MLRVFAASKRLYSRWGVGKSLFNSFFLSLLARFLGFKAFVLAGCIDERSTSFIKRQNFHKHNLDFLDPSYENLRNP